MIWEQSIEGRYVTLQSVREEDAAVVLDIRQDPKLTKYLPRLDITIAEQQDWIREQREREGDYYFLSWSKKGEPVGTIRIYHIDPVRLSGETGSLALRGNAMENLETKLLCEDFAFRTLGLKETISVVNAENRQALRFAQLFGVQFDEPSDDPRGFLCRIGHNETQRAEIYREKIRSMLY